MRANINTPSCQEAPDAQRLHRLLRPRFAAPALAQADLILLLVYAEALANAYVGALRALGTDHIESPLVRQVLELCAKAEEQGSHNQDEPEAA